MVFFGSNATSEIQKGILFPSFLWRAEIQTYDFQRSAEYALPPQTILTSF